MVRKGNDLTPIHGPPTSPRDPHRAFVREAGRHTANVLEAVYGTMQWDVFAAHALQGVLAHGCPDLDEAARDAALAADAMMEERDRRIARRAKGGREKRG